MSDPQAAFSADAVAYHAAGELAAVRAFVRTRSMELGLPGRRAELLTLAVSELATNTLQHTSNGGRVRVWSDNGYIYCDVVDRGPVRPVGRTMPASDSIRGRGLAIVDRVCDHVSVQPVHGGTLVRMRMNVGPSVHHADG